MEVTEIPSILENTNGLIQHASETGTSVQDMHAMLQQLADELVNRTLPAGDPRLGQVSSSLDTLIAQAPGLGEIHDGSLRLVHTAATSLVAAQDDPNVPPVLAQVNDKINTVQNLREIFLTVREGLPVHDTLAARLSGVDLTPDDLEFISLHRLHRDRLGLITENLFVMLDKLRADLSVIIFILENSNDPRTRVGARNDSIPFALLPVRVETRFMTIKHVRNNKAFTSANDAFRTDADVSVAYDINRSEDILPFSSVPADGELQPPEAMEIVQDGHELWVRIYPDDIAIHTHEPLPEQKEIDAGKDYWEAVWRAGSNDPSAQLGPWRVLAASYGSERAAWIRKQTTPANHPADWPAAVSTPPTPFPNPPQWPALTPRPATWNSQPHTNVMPERFVVRVYSNNTYREVLGLPVPSPLPVGLDPGMNYSNYLTQSVYGLNMPPELRWLTDFEEAEKIGMGIRIPLQGNELTNGFDRILVLGLKLNLTPAGGQQLLEDLFDNHHYRTGLAIVPQGTPTNNTDEQAAGYSSYEPGKETTYASECGNPLFTSTGDHFAKADGQRLAEALGISDSIFHHVLNSNTYDAKEAIAMNRALWPATLGYYMANLLTPAVQPVTVTNMRTYFTNYVLGRGLIPAFRVGRQPYGVLPATVYSRWKYSDPYSFEAQLHANVLSPLNLFWESTLSPQVKHVIGPDVDPNGLLVNILGLHPASLSFYQRMTAGSYTMWNLHAFVLASNSPSAGLQIFDPGLTGMVDNDYRNNMQINYPSVPRILEMMFAYENRFLNGPVIDTLKLSETRPVQKIMPNNTNSFNYIEWLEVSTLKKIREEDFTNAFAPANHPPPQALLYLLLRHAWFIEHVQAAHCLLQTYGVANSDATYNHELLKVLAEDPGTGEEYISQEQRDRLFGVVHGEVNYENELAIQAIMQDLENNQDYQQSGMTPEQYEVYLRESTVEQVNTITQDRYGVRLANYHAEQAQWNYLTQTFAAVSDNPMEVFMQDLPPSHPCMQQIWDVRNMLSLLKSLPTARLERCLAEHLDTCSHRLDAWMNSLVLKRLGEQRTATPQGIYVGAYSILERVKPGNFPGIHVVNVSMTDTNRNTWESVAAQLGARRELSITWPGDSPTVPGGSYFTPILQQYQPATFIYLGNDPATQLIEDRRTGRIVAPPRENPDNEGYLLAPSLAHATTAAVLRAGYVAHGATPSPANALAVNLSSARVRKALFYIEGIRNGQTLGALLGYQFERALHEGTLDQYIYDIREEYPLVSGGVVATPQGSNSDAQASHVTDGLALIEKYRRTTAPFWDDNLTIPSGDKTLIEAEIVRIQDAMDAVGDLLLAEAVYQVSRGNNVKAGAVLRALGRSHVIPDPEIINTPRQGHVFTQRCVVQLTPSATITSGWTGTGNRAPGEPALNNWLVTQLPDPANIRIYVTYINPNNSQPTSTTIGIDDLDLQPLDLIAMFNAPGNEQKEDAAELSKRVTYFVRQNYANSDTTAVTIDYRNRTGMASGDRTIFELRPVLQGLVQLIGSSRVLMPEDLLLPAETDAVIAAAPVGQGLNTTNIKNRLDQAVNAMSALLTALANEQSTSGTGAAALVYTPAPPVGAAATLNVTRGILMDASLFGIESAVPVNAVGFALADRDALVTQVGAVKTILSKRQSAAGTRLSTVNNITDAKKRLRELGEIAKIIFQVSFRVYPDFGLYNATPVNGSLLDEQMLLDESDPFAVDEWMHGMSRVRARMGEYRKLMLLSESVTGRDFTKQRVVQLPFAGAGNNRWLGLQLPANYEIPGDVLSLVIETSDPVVQPPTCGIVIDEWTEQIPDKNITTGIAMHYDQPNNEAPQSILLAVTPEIRGNWLWNDLMDTLNETAAMAIKRAVEPDMIQGTNLSQVLPALVTPMTGGTNTSPSLDLARNMIVSNPGYSAPIDLASSTLNPHNTNDLNIN